MNFVGQVQPSDVTRISDKVFMTGGDKARNLSAYWVLLALSAVIASAGVINDSTATVIGAMIVAPLMTPILGTALSIVLARRRAMLRSVLLVVGGAALVIAIAFLLGTIVPMDITATTNSQVSGRISPRLIDLVAALATGFVGAFALIRSEISDTLPGVAIAISLVPPLAVVGLTAETGAWAESVGALLLFSTNVVAIIATCMLLLLIARVREVAKDSKVDVGALRGRTFAGVGLMLAMITVPLTGSTVSVVTQHVYTQQVHTVAQDWADDQGWQVTDVSVNGSLGDYSVHIQAIGRPPEADLASLRSGLDSAGFRDPDVEVTLLFGGRTELEPGEAAAP